MSKSESKQSETKSVHPLISSDRVEGTHVYNKDGEKLGTIDYLMIDKLKGTVEYAVLSFGGFLGLGEHQHPLPWAALDYEESKDGYVVDLNKEDLHKAPSFERNDIDQLRDEAFAASIFAYYRFPIY